MKNLKGMMTLGLIIISNSAFAGNGSVGSATNFRSFCGVQVPDRPLHIAHSVPGISLGDTVRGFNSDPTVKRVITCQLGSGSTAVVAEMANGQQPFVIILSE